MPQPVGQFPELLLEALKEWLGSRADQFKSNIKSQGEDLAAGGERAMNAALNVGPGAIKGYHGSPHRFRQFDDRSINTGEGSQVEGWGHYVSEAEKVGKGYANMIGGDAVVDPRGRVLANSTWENSPKSSAWRIISSSATQLGGGEQKGPALFNLARQQTVSNPDLSSDQIQEVLRYLKEWEQQNARVLHAGRLYDVEMRWPSAVQEFADPLSPHHFLDRETAMGAQDAIAGKIYDRLEKGGTNLLEPDPFESGKWYYERLAGDLGPKQASAALFDAGIPGSRYWDTEYLGPGGSTIQNYVAFSDMLLDILRRRKINWSK